MRAHRPLGELGVRSPGLVAVLMACLVKGENKQTNKSKQRHTDLQDKEQPLKERGGYCVVSYWCPRRGMWLFEKLIRPGFASTSTVSGDRNVISWCCCFASSPLCLHPFKLRNKVHSDTSDRGGKQDKKAGKITSIEVFNFILFFLVLF